MFFSGFAGSFVAFISLALKVLSFSKVPSARSLLGSDTGARRSVSCCVTVSLASVTTFTQIRFLEDVPRKIPYSPFSRTYADLQTLPSSSYDAI